MAGLYLHIPFCVKRCTYCDFFSSTNMEYKEAFLSALLKEMSLRKEYIGNESIHTVYIGGGTPSQLKISDIERIFNEIYKLYDTSECTEITMEANPDDMTPDYVSGLRDLPINRISMGVQSFDDNDLRFLNRRHNRTQAIEAVELCKQNDITNISLDLIYGLPNQTSKGWEDNLSEIIRLDIPHLSAYHLIYEKGTILHKLKETKKIIPVEEEQSLSFFTTLIDTLQEAGYEQYEISNFARDGLYAVHNSSYWNGSSYLGLGPSAHSYNQKTRQWNIPSFARYFKGIKENNPAVETEVLDENTRYNDFIITRLRTMWGIDIAELENRFGKEKASYFLKQTKTHLEQGTLLKENSKTIKLSRKGIFISDGIMSDLLIV